MAKLTVEEAKEFSIFPPDSILHLKVDELTEKEVQGRNNTWTKLEFKFKILGIQAIGDGSPVEGYEDQITGPIWGSVGMKLTDSPENRLRQWAEAILGMEMGVGFELDTNMFLGRECRGITSQYDKKSRDRNGNPFKAHQIESLLPKSQPQQSQQYAQPQYAQPSPAPQQAQLQPTPQPAQQGMDPWGGGYGSEDPPF